MVDTHLHANFIITIFFKFLLNTLTTLFENISYQIKIIINIRLLDLISWLARNNIL